MKTLKKTLCLVLAVVMVVGVLIIPANAATTTAAEDLEAKYEEALAVLDGLEIMTGDEGGYRAGDTITRQEAAAVVARLKETDEVVKGYPTDALTYADCTGAKVWGKSYIAYVTAEKIATGDEKGFRPEDDVTGYEFLKMALVALGYDPDIEQFRNSGDAWTGKVYTVARRIGLTDGLTGVNWTAPIKRGQVAQVAFNALQKNTVSYIGGTEIEINGAIIRQGATLEGEKDVDRYGNLAHTLGAEVHALDNYSATDLGTLATDDFGRPYAYGWVADDEDVLYLKPVAYNKAYTTAVTGKTLFTDLRLPANVAAANVTVIVDGDTDEAKSETASKAITKDDAVTAFGGNGTVTEAYVTYNTDGTVKNVTLVIINTYLDFVDSLTAADAAKNVKASIKLKSGLTYTTDEAYAKGDAVLVTKAYNKTSNSYYAVSVKKVAPTTLQPKSFTASTVTADKTYSYSAKADTAAYYKDANFGACDAYVDEYGYIIGFVNVAPGAPKYAVVLDYQEAGAWQSSTERSAKLLLADGTVVTATASLAGTSTWTTDITRNEIVRYDIINNVYVLTDLGGDVNSQKLDDSTWKTVKIEKNGTKLHVSGSDHDDQSNTHTRCKEFLTDSKTVFVVSNGNGYDVYNGIAAVPSMTLTASSDPTKQPVIAVATDTANHAAVVFVSRRTLDASSIQDVIRFVNPGVQVHEPNRVYTPYTAVVNGAITTVNVASTFTPDQTKLYTAVVYSANGDVTGATPLAVDTNLGFLTGTGYDAASGNVITLYGLDGKLENGTDVSVSERYAYDANTKVFLISGTTVKAVSMNDIATSGTNTTQVLMSGNVISELYVTVTGSLTMADNTTVATVGSGETIDASSHTLTVEGNLQRGAKVSTSNVSNVEVKGNCMESVEVTGSSAVTDMKKGVVFETPKNSTPTGVSGGNITYNTTYSSITVRYNGTDVTEASGDKVVVEITVDGVLKGKETHDLTGDVSGVWAFCPLAPGSDTKGPDGTGTMAALVAGDYVTVKITFTDNDTPANNTVINCGFTVSAD